jgi:hypothetical protein
MEGQSHGPEITVSVPSAAQFSTKQRKFGYPHALNFSQTNRAFRPCFTAVELYFVVGKSSKFSGKNLRGFQSPFAGICTPERPAEKVEQRIPE